MAVIPRLSLDGMKVGATGNTSEGSWCQSGRNDQIAASARRGPACHVVYSQIENEISPNRHFPHVEALGDGSGQRLQYVHHRFDLGPWSTYSRLRSFDRDRGHVAVSSVYRQMIPRSPFEDERFERVAAKCAKHQVDRPALALQEMRRVFRPSGLLRLLLPTDPIQWCNLAKK